MPTLLAEPRSSFRRSSLYTTRRQRILKYVGLILVFAFIQSHFGDEQAFGQQKASNDRKGQKASTAATSHPTSTATVSAKKAQPFRTHNAPMVFKGRDILSLVNYPIRMYRLFRNDGNGQAVQIPFQMDEINIYGDFVLDQGKLENSKSGNGIFDVQDELALMGNDIGPVGVPTRWPQGRPTYVHELRMDFTGSSKLPRPPGAVYVGIYFANPPPLVSTRYVSFDQAGGKILTSRFRYRFNRANYLAVDGIDVLSDQQNKTSSQSQAERFTPIVFASTFSVYADIKYFLSLSIDHRDVDSELEAFKVGPVRSIVRFSFLFSLLRLKFKLGMYTELSFFSNAVFLPAILYNPVDGPKTLNSGSGFYYGFALRDNPADFEHSSNMPLYQGESFFSRIKRSFQPDPKYWFQAAHKDYMFYLELTPSVSMVKDGNIPQLFMEKKSGKEVLKRKSSDAEPLGESPVNMAAFFDLSRFSEGEHNMGFQLYFENRSNPERLADFRELSQWRVTARRLSM